jgi:hypothetical protein
MLRHKCKGQQRMKETHIHILEFNTGDWIASGSCRYFHWGKNSLIRTGHNGRYPSSRTAGISLQNYHGCTRTNFVALVNGAVRTAVNDRSGTPDLKIIQVIFGSRNTRPYI